MNENNSGRSVKYGSPPISSAVALRQGWEQHLAIFDPPLVANLVELPLKVSPLFRPNDLCIMVLKEATKCTRERGELLF